MPLSVCFRESPQFDQCVCVCVGLFGGVGEVGREGDGEMVNPSQRMRTLGWCGYAFLPGNH